MRQKYYKRVREVFKDGLVLNSYYGHTKSWQYFSVRVRVVGKNREFGLGRDLTIKEAQEKAAEIQKKAREQNKSHKTTCVFCKGTGKALALGKQRIGGVDD